METVTVSLDYQVSIPDSIRKALGIEPGQEIRLLEYGGVVHMVPVMAATEARGFLEGVETHIERESDRI
ncbi:MAG: AbrB/MazE/SpoVT family DNA-binding domain-containing protein [Dehalococcoidia bacterium]|nr:AbrB/MazE/SpoVT family DNA-binding domain-containing protein [Dehalococcoidia bacterium]